MRSRYDGRIHAHGDVKLPIAFVLITGCASALLPGVSAPTPASATTAAVYEALIASLALGDAPVYVKSTSEQFRIGPRQELRTRGAPADSFPTELARRLEEVSLLPRAAATLSLPRAVRIVTEEESDQIQEGGLGARVVLAVSPVAISDDSTDALVYYGLHCGSLCGHGAVVWFHRGSDGRWQFRNSYQYWIASDSPRAPRDTHSATDRQWQRWS